MSSISRRRNGLMALSVIGGSCLGCGLQPLISRQDACFCYSPRPFPCYKLPRERFSPSAHPRHFRTLWRRSLHNPICRPSLSCVDDRRFVEFTIHSPASRLGASWMEARGNEGWQSFREVLEILGETPVSPEPREGPLEKRI